MYRIKSNKTQRSWCLEFYLVRVFINFKLYVSEQRDPDKIAQTHMLSWAFADHISHKYQQAIYEIPWYQFTWGTAQVDINIHVRVRAAQVPSVWHAAWVSDDTETKCNRPWF